MTMTGATFGNTGTTIPTAYALYIQKANIYPKSKIEDDNPRQFDCASINQ